MILIGKIAQKMIQKLTLKIEKMKNQENETNEKNLNEFLEFCKSDMEFIEIETFANSVKVYFDRAILCLYFEMLNKIDHKYFVYRTQISDCENVCLFIYKKKCYEFN